MEYSTQRGGNPVDKDKKVRDEETDPGLTRTALASASALPEVRGVATVNLGVGGASQHHCRRKILIGDIELVGAAVDGASRPSANAVRRRPEASRPLSASSR
jgi:hypothetical protein